MLKEYVLPTILPVIPGICDPHFHDEVEVMFVLKGRGRACCNGTYYEQPTGSILFVSPRMIHSYDNRSDDFFAICVFVNMKRLNDLVNYSEELRPENPVWLDSKMEHPIFQMVHSVLNLQGQFHDKSVFFFISGLLNEVIKLYKFGRTSGQNTSLQKVLDFCQEHFHEPLSVRSVASELSLSEGHISHLFTYRIRQSFPDYVNALRLNEAVHLMQQEDKSLSDICARCGFNSIRTFNRAFLKQYGISPSQYRKNQDQILAKPIA